jgi:hypothetical protein
MITDNLIMPLIVWLAIIIFFVALWFFYTPPSNPRLPKYLFILSALEVAQDKGQSEWTGSMAWTKKELTKTIIAKTAVLDGKMDKINARLDLYDKMDAMNARMERIESLLLSMQPRDRI